MPTIRSVEKALRLLQAIDAQGDWVGVRDLARRVNLTPPTTHNLLKTMQALSFVDYDANTKQYRLGLAAVRLGDTGDPMNQLRRLARPYLEALAGEFDESVVALTWANDQAIVVDWIQAEHPLTVTHNHGVVEHPIVFASGRLLLAYQDRATQISYGNKEQLHRIGPNSPTTTEEMLTLLNQIAVDGHAITRNVANSGIAAAAAPVFDGSGRIVLAIGCSAPVARSTEAQIAAVLQRLRELAAQMTRQLAGSGAERRQTQTA